MEFNQREWVTDLAVGTFAGLGAAVVAALLLPDVPFLATLTTGGVIGFVRAALSLPLKSLFELRPRDERYEKERDNA